MIKKSNKKRRETLKDIRKREQAQAAAELKEKCNKYSNDRFGEDTMKKWSVENQGIWYLPILDDDGNIEFMALMKPIDRHILSYASTKIEDEGLYAFLEQCMRECFVAGDECILDEDDYFIPSAMKFNKILEGKKAALVKR